MGGRRLVVLMAVMALIAAGCGTRLDDEDFVAAGTETDGGQIQGGDDSSGGTGDGGNDGGGEDLGGTVTGGGGGEGGPTGGESDASTDGGGQPGQGSSPNQPNAPRQGGGGAGNRASDVGVTPTSIRVGNITSIRGPLGPDAFTPPYRGARVFFQAINEREGGINGRKVEFATCDDQESAARNKDCAENLVEGQKVFALVASSTQAFQSASYLAGKGVPEVGGQPIGNAYQKYPNMYTILGTEGVPRDGKQVGVGGKLYARTGSFRYFKEKAGVDKAAVFFYAIAISRTAGLFIADGLKREKIDVVYFGGGSDQGRNPADPSYDTDVVQMRNRGVQGIWNAIDIAGFQKLCQAMDRFSFRVKANVSTIQGWSQKVGEDFSSPCRNDVYAGGTSAPYSERAIPAVARFNADKQKYDPQTTLHQWMLEGYAAGQLFTDGVKSMGPAPTRAGLIKWLDGVREYSAGGLLDPRDWRRDPNWFKSPKPECISIVRWGDRNKTFGAVTNTFTCYNVPWYSYTPQETGE